MGMVIPADTQRKMFIRWNGLYSVSRLAQIPIKKETVQS